MRFTISSLAILFLAELILGVGVWVNVRQSMFDLADSAVEGQADDVKRFLEARKNEPAAQMQAEIGEMFKIEHSRDYVQISEAAGNVIYRSQLFVDHPLPPISADDADRPAYSIYKLGPERVRVISEPVEAGGHAYVVRVGHLMNQEYESLIELRRMMVLYGSLIFLVGGAAVFWLNRRLAGRSAATPNTVSNRNSAHPD